MKYVIELNFRNGVHFGADIAGYGVETVQGFAHSDTIFSALINTLHSIRHQFASNDWVQRFFNGEDATPPFTLSSFGFVEQKSGANYQYYLPKPMTPIKADELEDYGKEYKKLKYIPLETFRQWQQGKNISLAEITDPDGKYLQSFWEEAPKTQHITDSLTSATQIYRTGLVFYKKNISPFFIVDLDETRFSFDDFLILMHALKYNGLGGRRTSGCGAFDFSDGDWFCIDREIKEMKAAGVKNLDRKEMAYGEFRKIFQHAPGSYYLFSTFFPKSVSPDECLAYNLVQRKGWFFSTASHVQLKRKTCYMFSEGSVFSAAAPGKLVDVTPKAFNDHSIYRNGIPFYLPFCEVSS